MVNVHRFREVVKRLAPPDAVDPQTGGQIWEIWHVVEMDEVEVHYGHIAAHQRTGAHKHPDTSHYLVIVQGRALVWQDGVMKHYAAGDFVEIPIGVLHDFGAGADEDLWNVSLTTPPVNHSRMEYDESMEADLSSSYRRAWSDKSTHRAL